MLYFKVETNAGYCGTDEEEYIESESESEAEAYGYEKLESGLSVEVTEVSEAEFKQEQ